MKVGTKLQNPETKIIAEIKDIEFHFNPFDNDKLVVNVTCDLTFPDGSVEEKTFDAKHLKGSVEIS